jgi:hypothetical protein
MNFLRTLFKRTAAPAADSPVAGERWVLSPSDGSPWPVATVCIPVTILDVRDGWVRYYCDDMFPDNRKTITDFVSLFRNLTAEDRGRAAR